MELLGLLALVIVIGIPAVAIVALVKSRAVERRIEEDWYKVTDVQGDVAGLRRELAKLSSRVAELETSGVAPLTGNVEAHAGPAPSVIAEAPAVTAIIEPAPAPVPAFEEIRQPAPAPIAAFQASDEPRETAAEEIPSPEPPPAAAIPALQPAAPASTPIFATYEPETPRESVLQRLRTNLPLEQFLGMNLFAKVGIVLLVLGLALLGRIFLIAMGPELRVAMSYAISGVMLGGGIWLERRERYRLLGRTGIGGGWALLFFTTYAMHHVAPMTVMRSNTLDCILMLIVAVTMVAHTLPYRSQLVTGLAFLLAFSTVALSQDTVYSLIAGVILALGIAAIGLYMSWFELEIFGILASYGNHFYWVYKLYPHTPAGHTFPQFWPSVIILALYWLTFRISYVVRKVASPRQEAISTIAAIGNTSLLLAVMKFQATRPELAFYALLGLGALEFLFGQLSVTRRRPAAFTLLTIIGVLLIFAAVPFRFSGNNVALFWMIAAEALLIAGIVQKETLFRRLGLLAGALTGLLILFEARGILELRTYSEKVLLKDGILLLTCGALFYFNALFLRVRWKELFGRLDSGLQTTQSYLGSVTAFLGVWALLTADWTAPGWAAMLVGAAIALRYLRDRSLLVQAWALSAAVFLRAALFNWHFDTPYPHHLAMRLFTLPLLALVFYCIRPVLREEDAPSRILRSASLWAGTALLAALAASELPALWIAPAWAALAVAPALVGRRYQLRDLSLQEHVLAAATVIQLFAVNLGTAQALDRYLPMIGCAATLYSISRSCAQEDAAYRRAAAWLHTWTATALLAALAWHESPQPWLAVIWILFALALAIVDRIFSVEELPWQAHTLALLASASALTLNIFLTDKLHGVDLRLVTLSILVVALYSLARWVRLPNSLDGTDARHAYTWAAGAFTAWLLWCELPSLSVAPALGVFALLLFEAGSLWKQRQFRYQAYALLALSFVRIFLVNLSAATPALAFLSPRMYTVAPLTVMYFYVWARLSRQDSEPEPRPWLASNLIAYLGTGSVVALLSYELAPEWIIAGWAFVVVALMAATLLLDKEIFLEQTTLLTAGIVLRGLACNIFGSGDLSNWGWHGEFSIVTVTSALLFAALPAAFRIRNRYKDRAVTTLSAHLLASRRPDQMLFFAPLLLIVFTIGVRMNPGIITLAWGIVGFAVIFLGLLANQRSYRLTGLALLVLCIGKIVFRDAWQLDERSRYITFIVLGAALILVSTLYSKYRDQVSRLL